MPTHWSCCGYMLFENRHIHFIIFWLKEIVVYQSSVDLYANWYEPPKFFSYELLFCGFVGVHPSELFVLFLMWCLVMRGNIPCWQISIYCSYLYTRSKAKPFPAITADCVISNSYPQWCFCARASPSMRPVVPLSCCMVLLNYALSCRCLLLAVLEALPSMLSSSIGGQRREERAEVSHLLCSIYTWISNHTSISWSLKHINVARLLSAIDS